MASLTTKQPIHWCKSKVGGENPMQLKRKAISPAGNVTEVSLATGKTITSRLNNPYAQLIELELEGRDWVWYEDCEDGCAPVLTANDDLSGHCELCQKRETLIRTRQAAQRDKSADYAKLFESRLDKLADVLEKGMVGNIKPTVSMEDLQEVMTAPAPEPKPRRAKASK